MYNITLQKTLKSTDSYVDMTQQIRATADEEVPKQSKRDKKPELSKDTLNSSREIAREYQFLVVSKLNEIEDFSSKKCSMVTDLAKQVEALLALYTKS